MFFVLNTRPKYGLDLFRKSHIRSIYGLLIFHKIIVQEVLILLFLASLSNASRVELNQGY